MMIYLYNSPESKKVEFIPQVEGKAKLYTCGPTVYDEPHVGNWAANIRWDILVRMLKANDLEVERVMNITDVGHLVSDGDEGEDKMEKGARREGITEWDVAAKYTKSFIEGIKKLNMLMPEHLIKATDHIESQISLIRILEQKGYTYLIDDGLYFDTSKFPKYGKFANLDIEGLKAGARVTFSDKKRNPSDFVLWRLTPQGETRNMEWDSPWGHGIPGWHIECSAMAMQYLGETIDIHTGGIDHIPVHHTNEIAQSEAATGKPFSNYWLHANFLQVDGTKISKSLENGFTLADIEERDFSADDLRMFILQSHYRTESNFTWDNLSAARNRLRKWLSVAELRWQIHDTIVDDEDKAITDISLQVRGTHDDIIRTISDDLNTPETLLLTEKTLDNIRQHRNSLQQDVIVAFLELIESLTGLRILESTPDIDDEAKRLLIERQRARETKDYAKSDELRDKLATSGIFVLDDATGQTWTRLI